MAVKIYHSEGDKLSKDMMFQHVCVTHDPHFQASLDQHDTNVSQQAYSSLSYPSGDMTSHLLIFL